jgi:DNA-binding MarR family transcriptional regulator
LARTFEDFFAGHPLTFGLDQHARLAAGRWVVRYVNCFTRKATWSRVKLMATVTSDGALVESAALLRRAVLTLARTLRQRARGEFTPTQLSVIGMIDREGPMTLGTLAARERLSAPSITKVITVLEQARLIERIPEPKDRRVCRVALSATGARWIEANRSERDAWLAERLRTLSRAEYSVLAAAVPVIEKLLDDNNDAR